MKEFLRRNKYAALFSYFIIYLIWFQLLEVHATPIFYTHCKLDDLIPFCAWFLIPYLLWFPYVGVTLAAIYMKSKPEFCRLCIRLFSGMTICLIIYSIFPSGQLLRPDLSADQTLLSGLVSQLYQLDSSTNVCPSIHVYNTLCIHYTLCTWDQTKQKKWLKLGSSLLMILIIASTVLLKQHSVIDGFAAIGLWIIIECALQWGISRQKQRQLGGLSA